MKRASLKRAERLVKAASRSVGRTSGKVASEASLQNLLAEYDLYRQQYDKQEQFMQEPNADKLLDIKGVGLIIAATFVGEVGNISRFQDPRQIQKLAGLNLVENSFRKHKGKTTISRRGRKRLRHSLFFSMIAMLGTNQEFRLLHQGIEGFRPKKTWEVCCQEMVWNPHWPQYRKPSGLAELYPLSPIITHRCNKQEMGCP